MNRISELQEVISGLTDATQQGKALWTKLNPTTYSWTGAHGKVVLQRITSPLRTNSNVNVPRYVLEVLDSAGEQQLLVSNQRNSETVAALQGLYLSIVSSMTSKGIEFLKSLVDGVDKQ